MRLGGFEISRIKAPVAPMSVQNSSALMPIGYGGGWFGRMMGDVFPGAWQKNISACNPKDVLAFSAVYACVSLIAGDISKLRIKLVEFTSDNVWQEVRAPNGNAFRPVLTKPNEYQTRIQFLLQWVCSKLIHGNTYVLKERDDRNVVRAMYVLDPRLVMPYVAENGLVYYVLKRDPLSTITGDEVRVPASDIIHDRNTTLWHPLIGVSPIFACGAAAIQGLRIQHDSEAFFANASMPGGQVVAPGDVPDAKLERNKAAWTENFGPGGKGLTAFFTHGMKFEPMRMNSVDSQLVQQLGWTVEDVARCFHVPLHMLGVPGSNPSYNNIGALNQQYYAQTLQVFIEAIEILLDEGLDLIQAGYGTELDLTALVRMDPAARAETEAKWVGAGIKAPNQSRADEDWLPVEGGDTPYLQVQNYSLAALARRDAKETPTSQTAPAAPVAKPTEPVEEEEKPDGAVIQAGYTAILIKNADAARIAA